MKRSTIYILVVFLSFIMVNCAKTAKEKEQPFVAELAMPNFTLAKMQDSTMILSKDVSKEGIVLLMYFSPDCDHCQKEAEEYVSKKDSLSNIRTVWMSGDWAELKLINEFAKKYQIEELNPIAIGKDMRSSLVLYYDFQHVPYTAVYKDNQFIQEYRGSIDFDELISINYNTFIPQPKDSLLKKLKK